ncbi:M12 family metallo-peptidase [Portibacter lacus]|uniref:Peptidase M12B domain-containing protein n=1 Tax=Portibacter lacus TaxID=1099794 RepID=A0AA37SLZ3_9BACT|nr:M12 family metallo-peptidase [Portibacter lacus]GLR17063.1 hypothetical protein GCM10007940_16780 [Portibacter lacus]
MHSLLRFAFLLTFIFCVNITTTNAQDKLSPLTEITLRNDSKAKTFAKRVMHYILDIDQLSQSSRNNSNKLTLNLPTLSGDKVLELDQVQLLANSYTLLTQDGEIKSEARNQEFYRGKVKGDENSMVGMSVFNNEIHLIVYDQDGTYEVKKVNELKDTYSGIYSSEINNPTFIACQTDTEIDLGVKGIQEEVSRSGALGCVEIYLEIDYKSYTENSSDVTATENWALAIMAQVALFYEDSGIPIKVSGIKIYTTSGSDPYRIHGSTSPMLTAFRDSMNNQGFNGNLAHLLSGRGVGGGIAYLNVLCSPSYNMGVSGNLTSGGTSYGTYTWNINVIAHEIGHNFGSQHTHDCAWNGNNTQIDDCGNKYYDNQNKPELIGSCYDKDNVILPGSSATIMSYCHVVGGASINLNLGFHPLVRERIYTNYASSTCGGDEDCSGLSPGNNRCVNASELIPVRSCTILEFNNLNATNSGLSQGNSCSSNFPVKDVWFSVLIPENGKLDIETKSISGGLSDMVMQIYSGSCGSLSQVWCDDNSGDGNHAKITIDDLALANQELLIRVVEANDNEGTFGICVYSDELPCDDIVEDLLDLYASTDGENWTNNTGWQDGFAGNNCNYCGWYGIECNLNEEIISIDLSDNNLIGGLGNNFTNLNELTSLDLSINLISGEISEAAINTANLSFLDLSNNNFSGVFPTSIITGAKLINISAGNNAFSGNLPEFTYSTKLQVLDLSNNEIIGCFPGVYTRFLYNGELIVEGNDDLAFGGDFYGKPSSYSGFDFDKDGFCFEIDDCEDYDNTIYNGAPELCDGLDNDCDGDVDEGLDSGPNKWIGPTSDGNWDDHTNWSLGHVPQACEDTEIGMEGPAVTIRDMATEAYTDQYFKSICIGPESELNLSSKFSMYVKNGFVLNHGTLNINGYSNFANLDSTKNGIENVGVININSGTSLTIYKSGINGIYNKAGGIINNNGYLTIDTNNPVNGNVGLKNENIINNTGTLNVIGIFKNKEVHLLEGSQLNNTGNIKIGGRSWNEGGN